MIDYAKILAEKIFLLRKSNGLTQEELAGKLGLSFQAISKWENGGSSPDISLIPALAEIFKVHIDELFGKEIIVEPHFDLVANLPWLDDETIRGVVYKGHKILNHCDDISKFTFKYNGEALNVVSYSSIECGVIQNGANAACDINCNIINGGANAGCDVNCGGAISGGANAGCDINCGSPISGGANAGCNINCPAISGGVVAGCDIIVNEKIAGDVKCEGDLTCNIIEGNVICEGDIIYKK